MVFSDTREKVNLLMRIFSKDFALPLFWGPGHLQALKGEKLQPVQGYSGGVFLGNATLEFETWPGDSMGPRPDMKLGFAGLAFEPAGLNNAINLLDAHSIVHSRPEPWYAPLPGNQKALMWNLVYLAAMNSRNFNLFLCDYKPVPVNENGKTVMVTHSDMRRRLNRDLQKAGGGPLTLLRLKKVTLGLTDLKSGIESFSRLFSATAQGRGLFVLKDRQSLELTSAPDDCVYSVTLEVRSLKKASEYLRSRSMLGKVSRSRVAISETSLQGLKIFLDESEQ